MNDRASEWSIGDHEQCRWDIFQLWNSDGFKAALYYKQTELDTEAMAKGQLT